MALHTDILDLSHLGDRKPGDTYYLSPLSICFFGICN